MEFEADIGERDTRVSEGDSSQCSLDDEMSQTKDEEVGGVRDEGLLVGIEGFLESSDISNSNSWKRST